MGHASWFMIANQLNFSLQNSRSVNNRVRRLILWPFIRLAFIVIAHCRVARPPTVFRPSHQHSYVCGCFRRCVVDSEKHMQLNETIRQTPQKPDKMRVSAAVRTCLGVKPNAARKHTRAKKIIQCWVEVKRVLRSSRHEITRPTTLLLK